MRYDDLRKVALHGSNRVAGECQGGSQHDLDATYRELYLFGLKTAMKLCLQIRDRPDSGDWRLGADECARAIDGMCRWEDTVERGKSGSVQGRDGGGFHRGGAGARCPQSA